MVYRVRHAIDLKNHKGRGKFLEILENRSSLGFTDIIMMRIIENSNCYEKGNI